jgi:hypothetical protein
VKFFINLLKFYTPYQNKSADINHKAMLYKVFVRQEYISKANMMSQLKDLSDEVVQQEEYLVFISRKGFRKLSTALKEQRIVHKLETKL